MRIDEIDKNYSAPSVITEPDMLFINVKKKPFKIYGLLWDKDLDSPYLRMPKDVAAEVSKRVAGLCDNTAGGRVRFATDSNCIAARAKYEYVASMPKSSLLMSAGFDLYRHENGTDRHIKSFSPSKTLLTDGTLQYEVAVSLLDNPAREMRDYTVHFPLYNGVKSLEIGFKKDSHLEEGPDYRSEKPIVYYGSSITQGGTASHPGNCYPNLISQVSNFDHVNLGFSGSAKGEARMAEYIASLDMLAFVFDYDHNASQVEMYLETHGPFFRTVRRAHPDIPIIIVSRPKQKYDEVDKQRKEIALETYRRAKAEGDENVYFVDGEGIYGGIFADSCTIDNLHPNDAGFMRMAEKIGEPLIRALGVEFNV